MAERASTTPTLPTSKRLILASASSGRRELLTKAGYSFTVCPSGVDEPDPSGVTGPATYVQHVAWLKAAAIAPMFSDAIVLAADSIAWNGSQVIGKPVDRKDAQRILELLGGTEHELWSGVCLWVRPENWQLTWQERSLVRMKRLSQKELTAYLDSGAWEGKSGAYGIQSEGDPWVEVAAGSLSNVVGLPLESLKNRLNWLTDRHESSLLH